LPLVASQNISPYYARADCCPDLLVLQVEEIQNKPDTSLLSSFGNSLLDFGISNGSIASNSMPAPTTDLNNSSGSIAASNSSSKLDLFSKFKDTMVELINTDLSQPVPSASYHPSQQIQQPQVQRADQRKHAGNVHSTSYGSGPSPAAAAAADATQTTQTQQCQGKELATPLNLTFICCLLQSIVIRWLSAEV
jgi:hypothetical protein